MATVDQEVRRGESLSNGTSTKDEAALELTGDLDVHVFT